MSEKVALITGFGRSGSSNGNGSAISILLAKQGAIIEGADISKKSGLNTVKAIESAGGYASMSVVDVTDRFAVRDWVQNCYEKHGRIDVLVNNVGRSEVGGPATMNCETWVDQIAVNLHSAFYTMHAALPHMISARQGSIINISSIAGERYIGKPQVGYAAAKAGLVQLTKATAVMHAKDNVRLNCVVPGLLETPMLASLANKYAGGDLEGFKKKRNAAVPLGRMGVADDVAQAVLFLASNESSYITGAKIFVDGGITIATPGDN